LPKTTLGVKLNSDFFYLTMRVRSVLVVKLGTGTTLDRLVSWGESIVDGTFAGGEHVRWGFDESVNFTNTIFGQLIRVDDTPLLNYDRKDKQSYQADICKSGENIPDYVRVFWRTR
jgi:hypothetical protein